MRKIIFFILFQILIFNSISTAQENQIQLSKEISSLKKDLAKVERDQLNYKIEKDLIRETYSSNYKSMNMIITLILGVVGILGYIGIRDITSIKKEYRQELNSLREIQAEFRIKAKEFDSEKQKFDSEIKEILQQNELQNRKIKFIELKEKIGSLIQNNKNQEVIDFANAALELQPNDEYVLRFKARALCRTNQLDSSLEIYKKLLKIDPESKINILDSIEVMYFANQHKEAAKLISKNEKMFYEEVNGGLAKYLKIVELYHKDDSKQLIEELKNIIDFENLESLERKYIGWSFEEAKFYAAHQPKSENQKILQNAIWYLDGQVNGKTLCEMFDINNEIT